MGHAMGMLGESLQGVALAWRAAQARVVELGLCGYLPEALLAHFGRLTLAQQNRQRPVKGVAEAVLVILGGPQAQLKQRWRHWAVGVRSEEGRLELVGRHLAVAAHLDQD